MNSTPAAAERERARAELANDDEEARRLAVAHLSEVLDEDALPGLLEAIVG